MDNDFTKEYKSFISHPEEGGSRFLRIVTSHVSGYRIPHSRRLES